MMSPLSPASGMFGSLRAVSPGSIQKRQTGIADRHSSIPVLEEGSVSFLLGSPVLATFPVFKKIFVMPLAIMNGMVISNSENIRRDGRRTQRGLMYLR